MKKNTNKRRGVSKAGIVAIGAGLAAAGAGAYYLLGPKGKEHRKKAKALLSKMESEIKNTIKLAKDTTKPIYNKAVDSIADTYSKEYKMHARDIKAMAKKLKGEYETVIKKAKSTVKRVARKV